MAKGDASLALTFALRRIFALNRPIKMLLIILCLLPSKYSAWLNISVYGLSAIQQTMLGLLFPSKRFSYIPEVIKTVAAPIDTPCKIIGISGVYILRTILTQSKTSCDSFTPKVRYSPSESK